MFDNIEKTITVKKQEQKGGHIVPKKRGAPKKPNMVAKKIKVDKTLYSQVSEHCKLKGITISSFLSIAIRDKLKKE